MRFLFSFLCMCTAEILVCQEPVLRPSTLEAYIQQANVQVTWSSDIGRLDSSEAHVTVTTLLAQESASPARKIAGVKLELGNRNGVDYVYVSEEQIPALIDILNNLDSGVESFRNKPSNTPYRYTASRIDLC